LRWRATQWLIRKYTLNTSKGPMWKWLKDLPMPNLLFPNKKFWWKSMLSIKGPKVYDVNTQLLIWDIINLARIIKIIIVIKAMSFNRWNSFLNFLKIVEEEQFPVTIFKPCKIKKLIRSRAREVNLQSNSVMWVINLLKTHKYTNKIGDYIIFLHRIRAMMFPKLRVTI